MTSSINKQHEKQFIKTHPEKTTKDQPKIKAFLELYNLKLFLKESDMKY